TLAVGLFAQAPYAASAGLGEVNGLFFGGGFHLLGVQALGVVSVAAWVLSASALLFFAIKKIIGLRVDAHDEIRGLDIGEHGMEAYAGFQIFSNE
ncbi:MAG: ammonium transporter, partial [Deltaproteobacteria bacterium]|nr:ammonium transporter [Deltaproteobacteria bacterium]